MLAQTLLPQIERAFDAWIRGGRQGSFRTHLITRVDPSTLIVLDSNPQLLDQLSKKVRDSLHLRTPTPRRLATPTLGVYFPQLAVIYQKLAREGDTFEEFLDRLRQEYPTEEALLNFIRLNS